MVYPMTSCLLLAADWDGANIITVEGVLDKGEMHPVQRALVEKGGIQCGFCTPGFCHECALAAGGKSSAF